MENLKNITQGRPFLFSYLLEVFKRDCETGFWLPLQSSLPWRLSAPFFVWIPLEVNLGLGLLHSLLSRLVDRFLKPT